MPDNGHARLRDGRMSVDIYWWSALTEDDARRLHALVDAAVESSQKGDGADA